MDDRIKTECRTPTPGKKSTFIAAWKFKIIRNAILKVLETHKEGLLFKDLADEVGAVLDDATINKIGSMLWYSTTVKLEMEVREEIERIPGVKPQKIRLK